MPIKVNSLEQTAETQISRQIADKPICYVPPNNNKPNPFMNFFKIPIKVNSLEQTAKTQISRQTSSIKQYAVFHQIITNQTLL